MCEVNLPNTRLTFILMVNRLSQTIIHCIGQLVLWLFTIEAAEPHPQKSLKTNFKKIHLEVLIFEIN